MEPVIDRIKMLDEYIRKYQLPNKNKPIIEKTDIFYLECQKQPSKNLANYFLDIEVRSFRSFKKINKCGDIAILG